jgi:Endoglucanase
MNPNPARSRRLRSRRSLAGLLGLAAASSVFAAPPPVMWGVNLSAAGFGTNLPGVHGTDYIYPSPSHLDYYKARGIELIRFPFKWERLQHALNGPLDSAELARLDAFLDEVERRGMRVVLDMHNYGRRKVAGATYVIGSPQVPRSAFQDVWARIAEHVKDRDCLWGYGIMNEPYGMGVHTWKDSAQYAVNGIRSHDTRHAILIPGDQYSGAHWWLTHSADLHEIVDPADNLVFEAHQYFDNDSSGTYDSSYDGEGATPLTGVSRLASFVDWCDTHGVRGYVGEYGVPDDDPRWLTVLDNALSFLAANGISGTYWAGGPWWGDYALSLEPRRVHDEAPQMSVLIPYGSGVGTRHWPAFTWYKDSLVNGPLGSYTYHYKSSTASLAVDFADPASANGNYGGAKGIRFDYAVPPGGYAGAGMHITGGAALQPNFARAHNLSFQLKGTTGSSVRVFFVDVTGATSLKVNTAAHVTTSGSWQKVSIPLAAFVGGSFTGGQRIQRVVFEGLPADGAARTIQLDNFVFEKPETTAPTAAVSIAGSGSSFPAGTLLTAQATATDPGGDVDFVKFILDGRRFAVDRAAPYAASFLLPEAGAHRLVAIAYDLHGNPGRSTPLVLTATAPLAERHLTANDTASQTSFNSGLHWSDSLAPHAGKNYVVEARDLRTPGNTSSHAFAGASLTLRAGARLLMRTTSPGVVTVGDLRYDGGGTSLSLNGSFTLDGSIFLQPGGGTFMTSVAGRTLTISSVISGPGALKVNLAGAADHVTLTNPANSHSGGTIVLTGTLRAHAAGSLGTGDVVVSDGATLRLANGTAPDYVADRASLVVGASGTVELAFAGVDELAALSLDGGTTFVAPGEWGAVGSGAANTSARLTGPGRLLVTGAGLVP